MYDATNEFKIDIKNRHFLILEQENRKFSTKMTIPRKNYDKYIHPSWRSPNVFKLLRIVVYIWLVLSISTSKGLNDEEINDIDENLLTESDGVYMLENKSVKRFEKLTYEELKIFCTQGKPIHNHQ